MLTLQLVSDLHIEYNNDSVDVDPFEYITPSADVLVLAGDIGSLYKLDQLTNFIKKVAVCFKHTLYVLGNHEYYLPPKGGYMHVSFDELTKRALNLEKSIPDLTVLNRSSVQFGGLCVVGATLWSDLRCDLPRFIVQIKDVNTERYKSMHLRDRTYIEKMTTYCRENGLRMVCVTHHPPSYKVIEKSGKRERFISLYASDLDHLMVKSDIDTWVCGHVHTNFDMITEGGTRLVGNQKGKPKDKITDYSKDMVISYEY
jgi:Icc-related predicted phosphoesterase